MSPFLPFSRVSAGGPAPAGLHGLYAASDGKTPATTPAGASAPASQPVRVNLKPYGAAGQTLELSPDGRYLCAWGWPGTKVGDYNKEPGDVAVFDVTGQPVPGALDGRRDLQGEYIEMFPATAWRTHFAQFVKDAGGWGFRDDYGLAVRLVDPTPPIRPEAPQESAGRKWQAELWRMKPKEERLWRTELPENFFRLETTAFLQREGKGYVFLGFGRAEGYLLSEEDGDLVAVVSYGHIETDAEAAAYKRKFHLGYSDGDVALRFSSHQLAADPGRRLLACGAFFGKRVRVVSLDPPYKTVFEAHADENPARPWGGVWCVNRVQFAGGKYLIAELAFSGRFARWRRVVEIFDVDAWKRVWLDQSGEISALTIWPDGNTMAYVRGGMLEIKPFRPTAQAQK